MIRTVCGDITGEGLGFCDSHTHVFTASEFLLKNFPDYVFACDNYPLVLEELAAFKRAGGGWMVEAQPVGTGRKALQLRQASEASGIALVASTGFHQQSFYPDDHWIYSWDEDRLAALFIEEIEEGMYDYAEAIEPGMRTDIKAGQLKVATAGRELDAHHQKLMGAVAQAAVRTGAPVMCHTESGSALMTVEFLIRHGVRPERIIAAHVDRDRNNPLEYFDALWDMGVYMAIDTFSDVPFDEERRVRITMAQLEKGYADKLLLGWDPTRPLFGVFGGERGFDYLPGAFLQRLREAGAGEKELDAVTCGNPVRAWSVF